MQSLGVENLHTTIQLCWVPGHCNIEGNEKAHELVGMCSQSTDHEGVGILKPLLTIILSAIFLQMVYIIWTCLIEPQVALDQIRWRRFVVDLGVSFYLYV